jgi:hypothetical protein
MKFDLRMFKPGEGSHIPVLVKLLGMTTGPVLELGTGFNSTPLLHWLCNEKKRKLVSYESNPAFVEFAKKYVSDLHEVHHIENWDTLDLSQHWDIVFIDHAPGPRRVTEMIRVANCADYVVVHDTEGRNNWHYHYTEGFPHYKYRYDYTKAYPYTSVVSNFKDLLNL